MANTEMEKQEARFDARLPKHQKEFFERAVTLGGYRSLTEFVFYAAQEKAEEIVKEKERILKSEKDRAIFFNALLEETEPNEALREAAEGYKKLK